MERKVIISQLLDYYIKLLPEKQQICMTLYYNDDLSLGEIADNMGMTRQGVRDYLKRGESALEGYEAQLSLVKKSESNLRLADELEEIISSVDDGGLKSRLTQLLSKMKGMV